MSKRYHCLGCRTSVESAEGTRPCPGVLLDWATIAGKLLDITHDNIGRQDRGEEDEARWGLSKGAKATQAMLEYALMRLKRLEPITQIFDAALRGGGYFNDDARFVEPSTEEVEAALDAYGRTDVQKKERALHCLACVGPIPYRYGDDIYEVKQCAGFVDWEKLAADCFLLLKTLLELSSEEGTPWNLPLGGEKYLRVREERQRLIDTYAFLLGL